MTLISSALFLVTRSYISTVLYDVHSLNSSGAVWSVIAALYLGSMFFLIWFYRAAHEGNTQWSALVLELSNQLDKYVTIWELLAVDDPQQLLAAINQIQQLLDASLASFTGLSSARDKTHAVAALEHAVQTLDFLHLAHRNLIAELGSTQPIMRLVGSLGIVRNKLMQVRSKVTAGTIIDRNTGTTTAAAAVSPTTLLVIAFYVLNGFAILFAPPLGAGSINLTVPLALLAMLCAFSLTVWCAQYPFSPLSSSQPPFPTNLLSSIGVNMLVNLEPLHYLRSRLLEKETETQARIDNPELEPQHALLSEEAEYDDLEDID